MVDSQDVPALLGLHGALLALLPHGFQALHVGRGTLEQPGGVAAALHVHLGRREGEGTGGRGQIE
jgi:hypothetical protein